MHKLPKYELAPFPLDLFNKCDMRKARKSALYDVFSVDENATDLKLSVNMIHGKFLLHRAFSGIQDPILL